MPDTPGKTKALKAALRVPAWVRDRLLIDVYEVDDDGPSLVALFGTARSDLRYRRR
jgi:hypothetical protein